VKYLRGKTVDKQTILVKRAAPGDAEQVASLALALWPDHDPGEMQSEIAGSLAMSDTAFFLARRGEEAVGFAQCQLRHDYVEGTDTRPVGYLEGIYVEEAERRRGVARALLARCEAWARAKGCTMFASDCEWDNAQSLSFHMAVGFREANRIICFVKDLS